MSRDEIIAELDRPFSDKNTERLRLLKSHVFSLHLEFIQKTFPKSGIIVVWRESETCLKWWLKLGGFDIPYPKYDWYKDVKTMQERIEKENECIERFVEKNHLTLEPMSQPWVRKTFGVEVHMDHPEYFDGVMVASTKIWSP